MKLFCVALCLGLMTSVSGQGGFFSNIINTANRFNPFNRRPSRPSAPFTSFSQPSQPSAPTFSRPSSQPRPSSGSVINEIPAPSLGQQQTRPSSSGGRGNHQWRGGDYLLSWREGVNNLSWGAARSYCSSRGMRMVSLDDAAKRDHFMQQVAADGAPYFWAGGRISSNKRNLSWENGRSQGISQGRHPWSFTGSRGAQPDGRGSEDCLAILNNFYNDGVKFHDVGCSHTKPTVCEA